jgi:hypothetical protein
MRELKFEFGFQSINGIIKKVYPLSLIPFIKDKCDLWNELPFVYVREFTGLKDSDGLDIYEGDIMKDSSGCISTVVYLKRYASYKQLSAIGYSPISQLLIISDKDTVIGNIHENKDLV